VKSIRSPEKKDSTFNFIWKFQRFRWKNQRHRFLYKTLCKSNKHV